MSRTFYNRNYYYEGGWRGGIRPGTTRLRRSTPTSFSRPGEQPGLQEQIRRPPGYAQPRGQSGYPSGAFSNQGHGESRGVIRRAEDPAPAAARAGGTGPRWAASLIQFVLRCGNREIQK